MNPSIQLLGNAVLVQGPAVDELRYAIRMAMNARNRNGLAPPPLLLDLRTVMALAGQRDVHDIEEVPESEEQERDNISVQEAADMLGLSNRQTRRRAPDLGGRIVSGRWLLDRHTVTTYLKGSSDAR